MDRPPYTVPMDFTVRASDGQIWRALADSTKTSVSLFHHTKCTCTPGIVLLGDHHLIENVRAKLLDNLLLE